MTVHRHDDGLAGIHGHVVVVGGGVVGLTVATVLLDRSPGASVTVVERATVCGGASGYAGAVDIPYFHSPLHRRLVGASWRWHRAGGRERAGYRSRVPISWLVRPGPEEEQLRASLDPPPASAPTDAGGWAVPDGLVALDGEAHLIDPPALCRYLARDIRRSGRGRVVEHAAVRAVGETATEVAVELVDGRTVTGERAVVAVGPWLLGMPVPLSSWAREVGVRNKRVFGLRLKLDEPARARRAVSWPAEGICLFPLHDDDGYGYGMSVRHDEWDADPDRPGSLPEAVLSRAAAFLDAIVGAGRWTLEQPRVFVDTYTAQVEPVVAACPAFQHRRVVVVTGTHGSGVRLAPGLADLVVTALLDD
jgi:glycine/D-amino acid oxidase-like deaminating enzyme